jgi:ubiquinone/menaquinone biosynthesis C-methylase UbiE
MTNSHPQHTGFIPRFNAWLLHKGGDQYNQLTDERKRSLFSGLTGQVLEIGPGAGANLEYYSEKVSLIGLEPNPYMQNYLKEKASKLGKSIEIITGKAEAIPLDDENVDAVVSTLVLCSVINLQETLSEIKRVLKPGGVFLFMEHVAAAKGTFLRSAQRWIKPLWKKMADGCHPDRETWKAIEAAGFSDVKMDHFRLSLPVVGPQIMGKAVKE